MPKVKVANSSLYYNNKLYKPKVLSINKENNISF